MLRSCGTRSGNQVTVLNRKTLLHDTLDTLDNTLAKCATLLHDTLDTLDNTLAKCAKCAEGSTGHDE